MTLQERIESGLMNTEVDGEKEPLMNSLVIFLSSKSRLNKYVVFLMVIKIQELPFLNLQQRINGIT